jgi:hypothetical protein
MKIISTLVLFVMSLFAENPAVYAPLGNVVYNNVEKIAKLKNIDGYAKSDKIVDYVEEVAKTKEAGFAIELGKKSIGKKTYLSKLRKLAKINDFYIREVYKAYNDAIITEDSFVVSKMINSGLMDTDKFKNEIIEYYFKHMDTMDTDGVVQKYLDENAKSREHKKIPKIKKRGPTKEELQKAKIERLRRNDKLKQEAIQKTLEKEIIQEKLKIREEQLRELRK